MLFIVLICRLLAARGKAITLNLYYTYIYYCCSTDVRTECFMRVNLLSLLLLLIVFLKTNKKIKHNKEILSEIRLNLRAEANRCNLFCRKIGISLHVILINNKNFVFHRLRGIVTLFAPNTITNRVCVLLCLLYWIVCLCLAQWRLEKNPSKDCYIFVYKVHNSLLDTTNFNRNLSKTHTHTHTKQADFWTLCIVHRGCRRWK